MSKLNFNKEGFDWYLKEWVTLKESAIKQNTKEAWELYRYFLEEGRKTIGKIYARSEDEDMLELLGRFLKRISSELKEIVIKSKQ
jgi:hypothetical protein